MQLGRHTEDLTASQAFQSEFEKSIISSALWLNSPIFFNFLQRKKAYSDAVNVRACWRVLDSD